MIGYPRLILLCAFFATAAMGIAADPLTTGIRQFREAYGKWDQSGLWNASRSFQQAVKANPESATAHYWLGVAHFHRMLSLRGNPTPRMDRIANHEMHCAINALDTATTLAPDHAESHALLATLHGMQIGDSLLDAVRHGPDVHKHHKLALKHGANNPRVQYLHGAALLHTADDDADRQSALKALLLADRLYREEAKMNRPTNDPRWGHDACLTFLGETYASLKQPDKAAAAYRTALRLRPDNRTALAGLRTLEQH